MNDEAQDSPKVPRWPTIEIRRRGGLSDVEAGFGDPTDYVFADTAEEFTQQETETYIPLSALLSDEVVEAVASDRQRRLPASRPSLTSIRRDLQAAVEQVGGSPAAPAPGPRDPGISSR